MVQRPKFWGTRGCFLLWAIKELFHGQVMMLFHIPVIFHMLVPCLISLCQLGTSYSFCKSLLSHYFLWEVFPKLPEKVHNSFSEHLEHISRLTLNPLQVYLSVSTEELEFLEGKETCLKFLRCPVTWHIADTGYILTVLTFDLGYTAICCSLHAQVTGHRSLCLSFSLPQPNCLSPTSSRFPNSFSPHLPQHAVSPPKKPLPSFFTS